LQKPTQKRGVLSQAHGGVNPCAQRNPNFGRLRRDNHVLIVTTVWLHDLLSPVKKKRWVETCLRRLRVLRQSLCFCLKFCWNRRTSTTKTEYWRSSENVFSWFGADAVLAKLAIRLPSRPRRARPGCAYKWQVSAPSCRRANGRRWYGICLRERTGRSSTSRFRQQGAQHRQALANLSCLYTTCNYAR